MLADEQPQAQREGIVDGGSSPFSTAALDPLLLLSFEPTHATLDRFVFGDLRSEAVDGLQAYFHHELYTGRRFERLDGGGGPRSLGR